MNQSKHLLKPNWSDPCLCGSSKKFKSCCKPRLNGQKTGNKYDLYMLEENYQRALLEARADVTRYTILHKSHTDPLIRVGAMSEIPKLLALDVNALGEYLERVQWLYIRLDRAADFENVLRQVSSNIDHKRWHRKVAYHAALHQVVAFKDEVKAREIFDQISPVTPEEDDLDVIQMFLQLYYYELGFAERIKYINQILSLDESLSNQLHYGLVCSLQYLLFDDVSEAKNTIQMVIDQAKTSIETEPFDQVEAVSFARCLCSLSLMTQQKDHLVEAELAYERVLNEFDWSDEGLYGIHREIGEFQKRQKNWEAAKHAFETAAKYKDYPILNVFLSETLAALEGVPKARSQLELTKVEQLTFREFEDYAFLQAELAIASKNVDFIHQASKTLESISLTEPYFKQIKSSLLLRMSRSLEGKIDMGVNETEQTGWKGFASKLNKSFILQPNIFGLGLNVNQIIEMSLKNKDTEE